MGLSRFAGLWSIGNSGLWSAKTTPEALNAWSNATSAVGVDATVSGGKLICKVPGYYLAHCQLSANLQAGEIFHIELRVNGATGSGFRASAEGIASGGLVNMALVGVANLKIGDYVQVYVYSNNAAGATFELVDGQFGILSI